MVATMVVIVHAYLQTFDECVTGNHSECVDVHGDDPEEGYFKMIPFFCGQQEFCR